MPAKQNQPNQKPGSKKNKRQARKARARRAKLRKAAAVQGRSNLAAGFTPTGRKQISRAQSGLGVLAKVITLPSEMKPVRYPTAQLDANKTAVWHVMSDKQLKFNNNANVLAQAVMLTHSPLTPVWAYQYNRPCGSYSMSYRTADPAGASGTINPTFYEWTDNIGQAQCYPARYNLRFWFYVPPGGANWKITLTGMTTGSATVVYSLMSRLDEVSTVKTSVSIAANGTGTSSGLYSAGAWVSINTIECASGQTITADFSATIGMVPSSTNGMWPYMNGPAIGDLTRPMNALRVNAAGLLLQNATAPLYKNGTVTGGKIFWSDSYLFDATTIADRIADENYSLRFTNLASDGLYTYLVPSQASLTFSDYTMQGGTTFVHDLYDFADVNYVIFNVVTVTSELVLNVRLDMHYEAISNSQIYNLGVPLIPYDEFAAVVSAASSLVPFTENPLHHVLAALGVRVLKHISPLILPKAHQLIDGLAARIAQL